MDPYKSVDPILVLYFWIELLVRCAYLFFSRSVLQSSRQKRRQNWLQNHILGGLQSSMTIHILISNLRLLMMRGFYMYFWTTYWVYLPRQVSRISFRFDKHLIPLPLDKTILKSISTCRFNNPNISKPIQFYLWFLLT